MLGKDHLHIDQEDPVADLVTRSMKTVTGGQIKIVINEKLAGGLVHWFTLDDANYLLMPEKLRRKLDRAHFLRECEKLPALYPWPPVTWIERAVIASRPLRSRFGLTLGSLLHGGANNSER